jgi:hypothetical protein
LRDAAGGAPPDVRPVRLAAGGAAIDGFVASGVRKPQGATKERPDAIYFFPIADRVISFRPSPDLATNPRMAEIFERAVAAFWRQASP